MSIYSSNITNYFFECLPLQIAQVFLSLFLLFYSLFLAGCQMFLHHMCLEILGYITLEVAVSTGKRLLASVRSHVIF